MKLVNNWEDITAQLQSQEQQDDKATQTTQEQTTAKRTDTNHDPTAVDDAFGVRPGRSTTLPVLQNDSDPDGDILTAEPISPPPFGSIQKVRSGEALQITVPSDATGAGSFTYEAHDGRGGSAEAKVRVTVHPWKDNSAPIQLPTARSLSVERGGEVAFNVRPDWMDPDGDPFYLTQAAAPAGMTVKTREDGLVTVRDLGTNQPGRQTVKITMTDGNASAEGNLYVDVREKGSLPPVANADHVRVIKGREVLVSPLANDTDPNGLPLRLANVTDVPANVTVTPDLAAGTFTFKSDTAGSIYLTYVVSDGPQVASGVVRVDVLEAATQDPPVAEDDQAYLPAGGHVLVDVLANDFDPSGGVLVIQSVSVPNDSPLSVHVIDRARLRVSAPSGLKTQGTFTYTVSNGVATAQAGVTVIPLPVVPTSTPPVAEDDAATVRVGDVVTVHVLDNDKSPSGLPLTIDQVVQSSATAGQGEAFVSQGTVRFKAGPEPLTVRLVYTIRDSQASYDSAEIVVTIRGAEGTNTPPRPLALTGRVLAGGTTRITVPLDGIDPDGDSVALLGVETGPSKGTATAHADWLEYSAPASSSGTDTFTYAVMDRYGARSTAYVQVGIAPPAPTNQAPIAVADAVIARPGRLLSVALLANDTDPDGDQLQLVDGSVVGQANASSVTVSATASRVSLTTPDLPGIFPFAYQVSDGRGGVAKGALTVDVRLETPLQAPTARDDFVLASDIAGQTTIDVDVLANDEDPDGAAEALRVSTDAGLLVASNGVVTVPLKPERQVIVYTVTDVDGLTGKAVIVVPGTEDRLPMLFPEKNPAKVKAGETLTIPLAEYVSVRDGHAPMLTFEDRVRAGVGSNGAPVIKDAKTLVFTPDVLFFGPTSVTFEVTDGKAPDDPEGLKAVLTLVIDVESSGKHLPTFSPADVAVAAGEPAVTVDLSSMTQDPDPGDLDRMQYSIGDVPGGFEVHQDGKTLRISSPVDTKAGTAGLLAVTVNDGSTHPVSGNVPLKAVSSTRPLMTVTDAVLDKAKAGVAETVDVTKYVTNPYAVDGKPITLVGSPVVVGASGGTATAQGLSIIVTPAAAFHGQMTVNYTVADATNDPKRQVQGRISLTVRDKPDPPTSVIAETHESKTATVSWTAGANNGAQITKFTVKWSGGAKDCGQVTTCMITGLTNNVHYTFTVVATNEVGDSETSAASNDVRPDVKPNPPAAPTVKFGDKQIDVTWTTPRTEGSPVKGFVLEISGPTSGATQVQLALVTSHTWTGLTNGASYTFRVQATSDASEPSDFSAYSAAEIPAGVPLNLTSPRVVKNPVSALPPSATVSWAVPDKNGDAVAAYELRKTNGATVYAGSNPSAALSLDVSTTDQTFQFRAKNKAGWSDWSAPSNAVRGFTAPGAVTNVVATETGQNNAVALTFSPAPGNGALPSEIVYHWGSGGVDRGTLISGQTISHGALTNGNPVQISVYARSTVSGEAISGPPTASNTVTPYGPPLAPSVSASGNVNNVTLSWNGSGSGNGRTITAVRIETTDGGQQVVGVSGSTVQGNGRNQTKQIRAQAQDSTGAWGAWSGPVSASTWGNPSYFSSLGAAVTLSSPAFCQDGCYYVNIHLRSYNPGSQVYCYVAGVGGTASWWGTYSVDGAGNADIANATGPRGHFVVDSPSLIGVDSCTQQ
ncbi:MAG: Ig-like domain-containing protein [Candidatus Phosphoribacter sp.]